MKHFLFLLAVCIACAAGCGGSGRSASTATAKKGGAKIVIHWPKSSRLIPGDAQSIAVLLSGPSSPAVTLTNGTNYVSSPGSGGTSSISTIQLDPGTYTVTAQAYPGTAPTAGGSPLAVGTTSLVIAANQVTPFSITMASTIDHIEAVVNGTTVDVDISGNITSSATSLPLIPTLLNSTTIVPKDASGDSLVLFPANLTSSIVNNADGKLIVGLVSSNLSNSTGSVATVNLVANADATTGYHSSITVNYTEGGTTLNSFSLPATMQSISFGSPSEGSLSPYINVMALAAVGQQQLYAAKDYETGNYFFGTAPPFAGLPPTNEQTTVVSALAAYDGTDGYWLDASKNLHTLGSPPNAPSGSPSGISFLAPSVALNGAPFVLDASGAYEYGFTTPLLSPAITQALSPSLQGNVWFAACAAPQSGYNYILAVPLDGVEAITLTNQAGVDKSLDYFSVNNRTYNVAGSPVSPLIYGLDNNGFNVTCVSPEGHFVGTLVLSNGVYYPPFFSVSVDPVTGTVHGISMDNSEGYYFTF